MPYDVFELDNEYCVYKVRPNGQRTGSSFGCHPTPQKAYGQIEAIEASEDKEMTKQAIPDYTNDEAAEKGIHEAEEMYYELPGDIVTFSGLGQYYKAHEMAEAMEKTNDAFMALSKNILTNPDVEDKPAALAALAEEYKTLMGSNAQQMPNAQMVEMEKKEEDEEYKELSIFNGYEDAVKNRPFGNWITDYYELVDNGVIQV